MTNLCWPTQITRLTGAVAAQQAIPDQCCLERCTYIPYNSKFVLLQTWKKCTYIQQQVCIVTNLEKLYIHTTASLHCHKPGCPEGMQDLGLQSTAPPAAMVIHSSDSSSCSSPCLSRRRVHHTTKTASDAALWSTHGGWGSMKKTRCRHP